MLVECWESAALLHAELLQRVAACNRTATGVLQAATRLHPSTKVRRGERASIRHLTGVVRRSNSPVTSPRPPCRLACWLNGCDLTTVVLLVPHS